MRATPRPTLDVVSVFSDCCSTISDSARKRRIFDNASKVEDAANQYDRLGRRGALSAFDSAAYAPLGTATKVDFDWLYDVRLVASKPGRPHYLALRDGNSGRCALCNVRTATTLDHHLPKSEHSVLVVTPDNLLPACDTCNRIKLAELAPMINPYFDDLGDIDWLHVTVVESTPYALEYSLSPSTPWPVDLEEKAENQFRLLKLGALYASQAVRMLSGMRGVWADLHAVGGLALVRQNISDLARSYKQSERNGWEAAVLAAAASSDWFCDGGFEV